MFPKGLRRLLVKLSTKYEGINIFVTDTGVTDVTNAVQDKTRVEWIREHSNEVLKGL